MEPIYRKQFQLDDMVTDCFDKLKLSSLLYYVQEVAGQHCNALSVSRQVAERGLFWAIIRHGVQITRLPQKGETITLETWPMPTTRVSYPRSVVALDEKGQELFRSVSLWVLMDSHSRAMVLPGKSGVLVPGVLRGNELPSPASLVPSSLAAGCHRRVCFTDLDVNGHMNNCRYLDWAADLLPSGFHGAHQLQGFTLCYLSEAREGEELLLGWEMTPEGVLRLDIQRSEDRKPSRIFSAELHYFA